jgi:UDP-3-O-[3-hydroxymyristoyl] N-acetylglucosamine deacetylase
VHAGRKWLACNVNEDNVLKQTTLGDRITLSGIGVHSGAPVEMTLCPAEADTGIVFIRADLSDGLLRPIRARSEAVNATELCTVVGEPSGASVSTIEHLMAAFAAMGVDNVRVELDGPEVPIMDGSSATFVAAIDQVGLRRQSPARRVIRVLKQVRIEAGRSWAEFAPSDDGFTLDVEIDFPTPLIGRQRRSFDLTPDNFRAEIALARTFGFMKDVEFLWKKNLALGASLDNTVALGEDRIINPEGLRFPDEFVRHKILDAVGDLALGGAQIQGAYTAYCPGHKVNALILAALLADTSAYEWTTLDQPQRVPLRGGASLAAVAFAADRS